MNRGRPGAFMGGSVESSYGRVMPAFRLSASWLRHALLGAALACAQALPADAQVLNMEVPRAGGAEESYEVAQADCYAVGEQVAAEQGGQLARASARNQGGRTVCVIVVLVPGRDGERPRRQEFVIPVD